jgi:hypothetical protein
MYSADVYFLYMPQRHAYGGERPAVPMTANEKICKDLLDDNRRAAIRRLVE